MSVILIRVISLIQRCILIIYISSYLIRPGSSSEIDYMYEIEDGVFGEGDGIDFESGGFDFPIPENRLKSNGSFSAVVAFDIGVIGNAKQGYQKGSRMTKEDTGQSDTKNDPLRNDTSIQEALDSFQSKLSRNGDYIFGTLLVIFGFISLVGNGSILLVFCFRERKLSPAEVFLVNLGVVDILLAVASYPLSMIASFRHRWDFGDLGCTLYAFVCYFLGVASIFSVTAIALIRYLKTCTPARGNQITNWTSCKIIAWGYLIALIWAGLPILGFGHYGTEPFGLSCTLDWIARDQASRVYIVLVTIFCVALPLIIIVYCYCQIIMMVKQSDALVRSSGVNKRNMKGSDLQLTWISGLVTLGFVVGWGPYTIVSLWASFRGEVVLPMWSTPIPVLMAKSSIAYNPIIYIFFTARYREDFLDLLQRWVYCHAKGGGKHCKRISSSNKSRRSSRHYKAVVEEQNSPASSSQATKQLSSSSPITPSYYHSDIGSNNIYVNYNYEETENCNLPKGTPLCSNNNENAREHNNDGYSSDEDDCRNDSQQAVEARLLIFTGETKFQQQQQRNQQQVQNQTLPQSAITMVNSNGIGANTFVASSKMSTTTGLSSTQKLLPGSASFLSIQKRSSCEEEHQV